MTTILFKEPISDEEQRQFKAEFPQIKSYFDPKEVDASTPIDIVYGCSFTCSELETMGHLHWIHVPCPHIENICFDHIRRHGNILVTTTREENIDQIGEYAMTIVGAFSKQLFAWQKMTPEKIPQEARKLKESMWTASNLTLLQIGLGDMGTTISKTAQWLGFNVLGIQDPPSFHPFCHKVIGSKDLHSALPKADIVCLAIPRDRPSLPWFKAKEFLLMKEESILMVFGSGSVIDIPSLEREDILNKFRGVALDAFFSPPIRDDSPLWKTPHVILTPEVGNFPMVKGVKAFQTFIHNLRQYLHGNFTDMRNLHDRAAATQILWQG